MYEHARSNCSEDGGTDPRPPRLPQLLRKYSFDGNCCQAPSWSTALVSARLDRCWMRTSSRPCFLFLIRFFLLPNVSKKMPRNYFPICLHARVGLHANRRREKNDTSECCVCVVGHVTVRKKGAVCVCVCVK